MEKRSSKGANGQGQLATASQCRASLHDRLPEN
jgi:hypothetical protein